MGLLEDSILLGITDYSKHSDATFDFEKVDAKESYSWSVMLYVGLLHSALPLFR